MQIKFKNMFSVWPRHCGQHEDILETLPHSTRTHVEVRVALTGSLVRQLAAGLSAEVSEPVRGRDLPPPPLWARHGARPLEVLALLYRARL